MQYDDLEVVETFHDKVKNKSYTKDEVALTPMDVIRSMAEKLGQDIKDPNPSCKKCQGRGYIGRDAETKAPLPCKCIYHNYNSNENLGMVNRMMKPSRAQRRAQERKYKKMLKKGIKV